MPRTNKSLERARSNRESADTTKMPTNPMLEWTEPDEDGDYVVALRGVENWHIAAHGPTHKIALEKLADAITAVCEVVRRQ